MLRNTEIAKFNVSVQYREGTAEPAAQMVGDIMGISLPL